MWLFRAQRRHTYGTGIDRRASSVLFSSFVGFVLLRWDRLAILPSPVDSFKNQDDDGGCVTSFNCGEHYGEFPRPETISRHQQQDEESLVEIVISLRKWFTLESSLLHHPVHPAGKPDSASLQQQQPENNIRGRHFIALRQWETWRVNYLARNCNNWRQIVINKIINFRAPSSPVVVPPSRLKTCCCCRWWGSKSIVEEEEAP